MKKGFWAVALVVFIIAVVYIFSVWFRDPNKVTDYGRVCAQMGVTTSDCKSWDLFATTYILDRSKETVTWYDSSGDAQRINCHIADAYNWWCDAYEGTALQGNGQNVIGFAGGKSVENTPAYPAASTQHFGIFQYWWFKII